MKFDVPNLLARLSEPGAQPLAWGGGGSKERLDLEQAVAELGLEGHLARG